MQHIAISNDLYDSATTLAKRKDVSISAIVERFLQDWVKAQTDASNLCCDEYMKKAHERVMQKEFYTPDEAYDLTMKEIKAIYDGAPIL